MAPDTDAMLCWLSMLRRRPGPDGGKAGDAVPEAAGECPRDPATAAKGDAGGASGRAGAVTRAGAAGGRLGSECLRASSRTMAKYSLRGRAVAAGGARLKGCARQGWAVAREWGWPYKQWKHMPPPV